MTPSIPALTPTLCILSLISLLGLTVLNVTLTTFDTLSITSKDFNTTKAVWYHRFTGPPEPGSQCSPYKLAIGEKFTTTTQLLAYTLLTADDNRKSLSYFGTALDSCDVVMASVDVDVRANTVTNIAYIACNSTAVRITAKVEYIWSIIPSVERQGLPSPGQSFFGPRLSGPRKFVTSALDIVSSNLMTLLWLSFEREPIQTPNRIFIQGLPSCSTHASFANQVSEYCTDDNTAPVTWLYGGGLSSYFGFANNTARPKQPDSVTQGAGRRWVSLGSRSDSPLANVTTTFLPSITDIFQVLISAVRLDFGHTLPNNPFLNMTVMNQTLHDPSNNNIEGSSSPNVVRQLGDEENFSHFHMGELLPGKPVYIDGEYECRFRYPISWAQATLKAVTLFATWPGIFAVACAFFVARKALKKDSFVSPATTFDGSKSDPVALCDTKKFD